MEAQIVRLKNYLSDHKKIDRITAQNELCIGRLASRISELKKEGIEIKDRWLERINKFGEKYRIKEYYI